MRLTSMSTHARLNKNKDRIEAYRQELERILGIARGDCCSSHEQTPSATIPNTPGKNLIVIVGSQKGLCGAFNTRLFRYFEQEYRPKENNSIIAIGKKMVENIEGKHHLLYSFNLFNQTNFFAVTDELCQHILGPEGYKNVIIYSSYPQSFFIQRPIETTIAVPRPSIHLSENICDNTASGYQYDQSIATIIKELDQLYMRVHVEEVLFESLIAEHAARFISMDSSTNNADKILAEMRRDYNKLRQASITRELMDLMSGLL